MHTCVCVRVSVCGGEGGGEWRKLVDPILDVLSNLLLKVYTERQLFC